MSFDPDAFLAQGQSAPSAQPVASAPQSTDSGGFDPDEYLKQANEEAYSGPANTGKAFLQGVGEGLIGPAAPFLERHLLHENPEDIRNNAEAHPYVKGAGQAVGLGMGMLTGTGEAALMGKAGELAAAAAGLSKVGEGVGLGYKVGSEAVKQAAEMAVLQGGDEVSKMVLQDPNASAENAIANIGMAAALGAGGGALMAGVVSPLWKVTVGNKADEFFNVLSNKLGGREGEASIAADLAQKGGIDIPPEFQAKIDGNLTAEDLHSKLSQSDTTYAGKKFQRSLYEFNDNIANTMSETIGVKPNYHENLPDLDKYTTGSQLTDSLHNELKRTIDPISKEYDAVNERFSNSPVFQNDLKAAADKMADVSIKQGWRKSDSDAQVQLMQRTWKDMTKQETAADLKNYITNLRTNHPFGSPTYAAAKEISTILKETQEQAITKGILAKGGSSEVADKSLQDYQALKAKYGTVMNTIDNLNEHLHVGKYYGPGSFLKSLKELGSSNGEAVLNRLAGSNRANVLELLKENAPETLAKVRQYHVDKLLADAGGDKLNPYKLTKQFDARTPQVKDLIMDQAGQQRFQALGDILEKMKDPTHNWSNTARTVDKLTHGAASPLTMLATMMGHGGEAILGHVGKLGFSEGHDALRLGMMKFLASDAPVKSEGLKAMFQFMHNTYKGENLLSKATTNLFKSGSQVLGTHLIPDDKDRSKLDKQVTNFNLNPDKFTAQQDGAAVGHYLPDHQAALTQVSSRALQYLQQVKPHPQRLGPLDREIPPSSAQTARYNRALDIAQQPAVVMQHIKDGTLQMSDIQDLNAMYPAAYKQMSQKLSNEMTNKHGEEEEPIPYRVRMGISLFLGQPVDSSMTPQSIMAAQPKANQPQQNTGSSKKQRSASGLNKLGKADKMSMTASQAAESDRAGRS